MAVFSLGRVLGLMYVRTDPPSSLLPLTPSSASSHPGAGLIQHIGAHTQGSETSCLCFSHDNKTLVTRGGKL